MDKKNKVLIADESRELGQMCVELLKTYGFDAKTCVKDGTKLLDIIHNEQPDIVILDVFMPHLDAIGVMKAIKEDKTVKKPLFFTMSSFDNSTLEREVLSHGAAYYLLKPFDYQMLAERISLICGVEARPISNQHEIVSRHEQVSSNDLEMMVTDIIHQIGVPAHIKGYHYLREAIMLSIQNEEIINFVTKQPTPHL
jgi:two-component system, response regulator, stage 0 sporulation protein A